MKKNRGQLCRIMRKSMAIAVVFAMSLTPILPGENKEAKATTSQDKTISGLGTNEIGSPVPGFKFYPSDLVQNTTRDTAWSGSYVYYGRYNFETDSNGGHEVRSMKYRVLDPRTQRFGGNTMFLDCDNILTQKEFYHYNVIPVTATTDQPYSPISGSNEWADENNVIRNFLNGNEFYNNTGVFTALEKNSIAASNIESHLTNGTVVQAHPDVGQFGLYTALNGEHVFLLDAEDLGNVAYGYTNDCRGQNRFKIWPKFNYNGDYWTRTGYPHIHNGDYKAGYICGDVQQAVTNNSLGGQINLKQVYNSAGVSPAFNVDLSKVVFSSSISGETNTHKLTLLDNELNVSCGSGSVTRIGTSEVFSFGYTVGNSTTTAGNTPTQVSYVVTNGTWNNTSGWSEGARVLQYGKICSISSSTTGGMADFTINKTQINGTLGTDYHVYLVAEDVNGGKATDYASAPVEIKPVVSVTAEDVAVAYDGNPHGIEVSVTNPTSGVTIMYGESESCTLNSSPTATEPTGSTPKRVYYAVHALNYLSLYSSATVTITKADVTGLPTYTGISGSGKTLADANLAIGSLSPDGGTIAWDSAATTEVTRGTSYTWTYTPTDTAHYNVKTGSVVLWPAGSGEGGTGGGGGGGPAAQDPEESPKPSEKPGEDPGLTIVEQKTETVKNDDGSTTVTTTTLDSEGTKKVESETAFADGTVEKKTDVVRVDGSTEKVTEKIKPSGATEKTTDMVTGDGTVIHEIIKTTSKGKETTYSSVTTPAGERKVVEQIKQPSGDYSKTTTTTEVKKDEKGKVIGETTTIKTEEKTGKDTVKATFVVDPQSNSSGKKTAVLKSVTSTGKSKTVTIGKTIKADGATYKVTILKKGMLKGNETKPKKINMKATGVTKVEKGAFNAMAKNGTILISGSKKQFEKLKKLIENSGLPKGVKIKRA